MEFLCFENNETAHVRCYQPVERELCKAIVIAVT